MTIENRDTLKMRDIDLSSFAYSFLVTKAKDITLHDFNKLSGKTMPIHFPADSLATVGELVRSLADIDNPCAIHELLGDMSAFDKDVALEGVADYLADNSHLVAPVRINMIWGDDVASPSNFIITHYLGQALFLWAKHELESALICAHRNTEEELIRCPKRHADTIKRIIHTLNKEG